MYDGDQVRTFQRNRVRCTSVESNHKGTSEGLQHNCHVMPRPNGAAPRRSRVPGNQSESKMGLNFFIVDAGRELWCACFAPAPELWCCVQTTPLIKLCVAMS